MSSAKDKNLTNTGSAETASADPAAQAADEAAKIIAQAEAKAAGIVAAAEKEAEEKAKEAAQAEAKNETAPQADPMEELVDYTAPLLPNMKKRDILVGVNGETLRIKRGVPVQIKRKFYNALQNAAKQEFAAMEARQEIQKQGEKPLASM